MRIFSWNINSIRIRGDLIRYIFEKYNPDIIVLQETKVKNEEFPLQIFTDNGYKYNFINGDSHYSGVAILSKIPGKILPYKNFVGLPSRDIAVSFDNFELHNLYVPAGGYEASLELTKFAQKIEYFKELIKWSKDYHLANQSAIILGDINIAPEENDVWSHKQLLTEVSHTPLETCLMKEWINDNNLEDIMRKFVGDGKVYSWWSYRNKDYKKSNRGRRLDHAFASGGITNNVTSSEYLHYFRDFAKTSDHVPLIIDLKGVSS
ncbi:MAG: endonuclease/exonuclease/phosphatase family protein [Alphaproteobacteria bacterium]|mgnify:CR=1 FL=1|nr:endonuclease/exonuclease/phosphatase family protein [Alphaproteobacteria bacterium]OJV13502.1 MAG: hypothetical protein BGO27_04770 [Alphaproteobacteria bacterium 33-17]